MRSSLTICTFLLLLLLTDAKKSAKQKQRDLANLSDEEIERMLDEMDEEDDDDNIVINKNPKPLKSFEKFICFTCKLSLQIFFENFFIRTLQRTAAHKWL